MISTASSRGGRSGFVCGRQGRGPIAFADGHVAFLKASMNYKTYKALSTRSGGEVISNDD